MALTLDWPSKHYHVHLWISAQVYSQWEKANQDKCVSQWLTQVAAWYHVTPDQISPNSGNTCPLVRPLTMPNFIVLHQTVYEKSVTFFYILHYLAPKGELGQSSPIWMVMYRPPLSSCQISSRSENSSTIDNCCQSSSISLTAWQTQNKNSSADEIANVNFYAVRPEGTRIRWNNAK